LDLFIFVGRRGFGTIDDREQIIRRWCGEFCQVCDLPVSHGDVIRG
jgi:hypothetical protein